MRLKSTSWSGFPTLDRQWQSLRFLYSPCSLFFPFYQQLWTGYYKTHTNLISLSFSELFQKNLSFIITVTDPPSKSHSLHCKIPLYSRIKPSASSFFVILFSIISSLYFLTNQSCFVACQTMSRKVKTFYAISCYKRVIKFYQLSICVKGKR